MPEQQPSNANTIYGRVVVLESDIGIPELIVECYDSDAALKQGVDVNKTSPNPSAAPSATSGESALDRLVDRLGSVLTGTDGRFSLSYRDDAFKVSGDEKRPDLVLIVYSPEDANPRNGVTPVPEQRALAVSMVPRADAGRQEAYKIRIPSKRLEKYQIKVPVALHTRDSAELAGALISAEKLDVSKAMREAVGDLRRDHQAAYASAKARGTTAALSIKGSSSLLSGREAPATFVRFTDDRVEMGHQREIAEREATTRSLRRMELTYRPDPLFISLTERDLGLLGAGLPELGEEVDVSAEELCHLMSRRRGGHDLTRIRDLLGGARERHDIETRLTRLDPGPTPPTDAPREDPVDDSAADSDVLRLAIRNQIGDIVRPPVAGTATLPEVSEEITGVSLPVGPADTTSYFDFHTVQIAFEHVWTQAFDQRFTEQVAELYAQTVMIETETGTSFDLPTELAEMTELQGLLTSLDEQIEEMTIEIPGAVQRVFGSDITQRDWNLASELQRTTLIEIAEEYDRLMDEAAAHLFAGVGSSSEAHSHRLQMERMHDQAIEKKQQGLAIIRSPAGRAGRLFRLMEEVRQRLAEPYDFSYFVPNSVNFGIVSTYRQTWEPQNYQVGDLVSTMPLAPGEKRSYVKKHATKTSEKRTTSRETFFSDKSEVSATDRVESEIVRKASQATNFRMTSEGSFSFGFGEIGMTSEFGGNQATESSSTKKSFREAVSKAAHEYRQQHKLEVESASEFSTDVTEQGEISNPNNEITVTYLFYELQRQFLLTERLHRLTQVILVAQEMPSPHAITESWLIAHEWQLRGNLLDPTLAAVFDLLKDTFAGSEVSVAILRQNLDDLRAMVQTLRLAIDDMEQNRDRLREHLLRVESAQRAAEAVDEAGGLFKDMFDEMFFDPEVAAGELAGVQVEAFKTRLKYLEDSLGESQTRLNRSQDALNRATEDYSSAISAQLNRQTKIDQLRVHVKQNILHYMQVIWAHEPDDQRFFRLSDVRVNLPTPAAGTVRVRRLAPGEVPIGRRTIDRDGRIFEVIGMATPSPPSGAAELRRLVEIADLDRPLGFKGNYIMFPLKVCTYLTEFMMRDYIDDYFGIRDPDPYGDFGPDELIRYAEQVWNDPTIALTPAEKDELKAAVRDALRAPRRDRELVVVPSGELFIEALVGTHPLLEDYKRQHRAFDAAKARAELREQELENLRRAGRMLGVDFGNFEQHEFDKMIKVEGGSPVIADTT